METREERRTLKKLGRPTTPRTKDLSGELLDWFNYTDKLEAIIYECDQENKELREENEELNKLLTDSHLKEDELNDRLDEKQSRIEELEEKIKEALFLLESGEYTDRAEAKELLKTLTQEKDE